MREGSKDSGKSHGGVGWQDILVTFLAVTRYLRMAKEETFIWAHNVKA